MSESKYKCQKHNLDIGCMGCIKATYEKYYRLLDFIKQISKYDFCDDPRGHKREADNLLKEIGEK